jgi:osmoprotectant transport system substrate-binding protein
MSFRLLAAATAALAGFTVAACSSSGTTTKPPPSSVNGTSATTTPPTATTTTPALPGAGKPAVTIGDKNYTEQFVLGELYIYALKAQGFTVNPDQNIGPDQVRLTQLQKGDIDMYPEYLNVWNSKIAGDSHHFTRFARAYSAAQNFALAHGLELLDATPFSDTSGIGVTAYFAKQNKLRTIGDLRTVAPTLALGGPPGPQFQQDPTDGLPAMEEAYGFTPATYKPVDIGSQYKALDQGTVQAAYVNTTDGEFTTGNYSLLTDTKKVFGIGNVVPVVSIKAIDEEGPVFVATINRVTALLTVPVIRQLNAEVDLSGETPPGVASRFLADHGLIPPSMVVT